MICVKILRLGDLFHEVMGFGGIRIFIDQPQPSSDTMYMGIDRKGGFIVAEQEDN